MVRYAFGALGMRRVGLTYPAGNEASRHTAEKLGFTFEGVQKGANVLPGGKNADRYCCARFDVADWARGALGLPIRSISCGCITGYCPRCRLVVHVTYPESVGRRSR